MPRKRYPGKLPIGCRSRRIEGPRGSGSFRSGASRGRAFRAPGRPAWQVPGTRPRSTNAHAKGGVRNFRTKWADPSGQGLGGPGLSPSVPSKRTEGAPPGRDKAYSGLVLKDPVTNESGRFTIKASRFSARIATLFFVK